ncbi:hypothetical protein [Bacillus toyonensis]|uniref:hypothetical protein n=1 Tax=Bacillus toyonensis TaxID=155322 RepID=UPI002175A47C|nr:hypothetical protein [Bacillus toyonensis]
MPRKFKFTEEEQLRFDHFVKTDEFAEVLAISWRYGSKRNDGFSIRSQRKWIVARFSELVERSWSIRYCEYGGDEPYWEGAVCLNHPLVNMLVEMGWSQITKEERSFPKGDFNEIVFVKTFILLLHDLGTIQEKIKGRMHIRPRLRIHGSVDVLNNIGRVLHREIDVGMKKLQSDQKVPRAKTIYFQSKKEIPMILEFAGATESLEKYDSFELGYQKEKESISALLPI